VPKALIEDLEWDEENEEHIARHVDPQLVIDLIEGGDWVQVRNKLHQPPEYIRLIGMPPDQSMLVAILAPTRWPTVWRPVTAYWPSAAEAGIYNSVRRPDDAKKRKNPR
jgi:hypothetical protein